MALPAGTRSSRIVRPGRPTRARPAWLPTALPWIRVSRLRNGPAVALIDLSVGGALLEADVPLSPGARLTLEIAGHAGDEPAIAPMRVLRCEIAALDHVTARYRGACEFVRPLELPALMPKPALRSRPLQRFMALDVVAQDARGALSPRSRRQPGDARCRARAAMLESRASTVDRRRLAGAAACRPAAHGGRRARTACDIPGRARRHRVAAAAWRCHRSTSG